VIYDYSKAVDEWFHFIGLKAIPNVYLSTEPHNYQLDLINALEAPARESAESSYWMVSQETTEEKMVHFHRKYFSL
jgi:LPS sulfotransferase NodH